MRVPVLPWALLALSCADPALDEIERVSPGDARAEPIDLAVDSPDERGLDADADTDAQRDLDRGLERDSGFERDAAIDASAPRDAAVDPDADPGCPLGAPCNPRRIGLLPYTHRGDTRTAPAADWDRYACAPDTDEGGGEIIYVLDLIEGGTLTVSVDDQAGDAVDVDVHLLDNLDPAACMARHNSAIQATVDPGRYFIAVDTWVNGAGTALAGPYTLQVALRPEVMGDCAMRAEAQRMAWRTCDPSLDCFEAADANGQLARFLRLPATGPVVKEAHLVTVDDVFPGGWPSALRDGIPAHYALSQAATGYVMARSEPWAPEGEGGSEWGQSAFGRPLPVIEEAFYVNMYWSPRPVPGTRMIVSNPANGRAVVAAAGYETGPGANTAIGGVSEEIHHHLGTNHRSTLRLGFAVDQTLTYGPIECP